MRWTRTTRLWLSAAFLSVTPALDAQSTTSSIRPPVVIVPGAPGAQLVERDSGRVMWPGVLRMLYWHGNDALALNLENPESTTLVPGKLIRAVRIAGLPLLRYRGYDGLEAKVRSFGYAEGDLAAPKVDQYFYFLYDWRLSFETNGRRLHRALRDLYARLPPDTPPAVVVAHSVGGLIARYALMYGEQPLGESGPLPPVTWEGAASIGTLHLAATPNGGSFLPVEALHRGSFWWKHWGAFSPDLVATFPAMWDLMPARPDPLVDERGRPLSWSLDRVEDWQKLGWGPLRAGSGFARGGAATVEMVRKQLARSRRLREALLQVAERPNPASLHIVGGECQTAQRTAVVIERPGRAPKIRFKKPAGGAAVLEELLREPGDIMISARSLDAELPADANGSLAFASRDLSCVSHNGLPSSPELLAQLERTLTLGAQSAPLGALDSRNRTSAQRFAPFPEDSASSRRRLRSTPQR